MFAARRALFGLAGGFAITDMYVNSVSLSDLHTAPPLRSSPAGGDSVGDIAKRVSDIFFPPPLPPPLISLREDIESTLRQNRIAGTLCICTLVAFGGLWPVLGSAAAILFDGEDGTERYTAVKDWLQD
ncbi:hypothetical protein TraAM80_01588 [Trypanosoma rangeli]|uniref:Uncharacterized protein n=1 Tax=Trypanosoma rangeli TaxID=5698 RepID=A0A422NYB3_TRYRA|nr:uncharacterized protein TraAM80_01588 [Trypanosoma rangeli]RNF10415.1 hypothetical protein TraAM80_01588 [Trypanosoma rangeli]|eukprot:RNF10415.1 hypothetical protein TraAM80_01588 [Trypanosoma rangeli]